MSLARFGYGSCNQLMEIQQESKIIIGESYQIDIIGLTHDGEGVGRIGKMVVFVPQAISGDLVIAKVISVKKTYARALINQMIKSSSDRIEPSCSLVKQCGGCQLAHLQYDKQLYWKQQHVSEALKRIGKIKANVLPIIGMENPTAYRNKAQIPVAFQNQELVMGFYQKRSHNIVDLEYCQIQHPLISKAVQVMKRILVELGIAPYDEQNHTGVLRHVVIRVSFSEKALMILMVTRTRKIPQLNELISRLRHEIPELESIMQNVNPAVTNVIYGSETRLLWGKPYLIDEIGKLKFVISACSFFQVNPIQTKILYDVVKKAVFLTGKETVWDLYCGIGTIGLYLAENAGQLIGVEIIPEAVEDARLNAKCNGIEHAVFYLGKAEVIAPKLVRQGLRPDVIIVDPPRKGCELSLLQTISQVKPAQIVYVSCNPATLARDLEILNTMGYAIDMVQPVDVFPQTYHIETIALLQRAIS